MPRRGENIYKRKDGRWEGRYVKNRNGEKTSYGYVYAKSYSDVKRKLNTKRMEFNLGTNKLLDNLQGDALFSYISELWLLSIQGSVKESTWIKYRNTLNSQIIPLIGMKNISSIDYATVSGMCNKLLMTGGKSNSGLSAKTVSDSLSIIKEVIKYANRMKYQTDRSVFDVSVNLKTAQLRVFTLSEEQLLFEHLTDDTDFVDLGILICMFTGIRLGELCALTWEDISLKENTIRIHQAMQRIQVLDGAVKTKIIITEPKSQCSIRDIPIAKTLKQYLKKFQYEKGYVLTGDEKKYIEPRTMQNRYKAILKLCGISDANFHTLRHTFATRCIEAGFDTKSLSEILGHANISITLNRYVHPSMEQKQKNMDKLSDLFIVK